MKRLFILQLMNDEKQYKAAGFSFREKSGSDGESIFEISHRRFTALNKIWQRASSYGFCMYRYMVNNKPHINLY